MIKIAEYEIVRLLRYFKFSVKHKKRLLKIFIYNQSVFNEKRIYRDPEILVPLIIYFYFRFQNISINIYELIESSCINKKLFFYFTFQIIYYLISGDIIFTLYDPIKILEGGYEKQKFITFQNFLRLYSHCPLCGVEHEKTYIISNYFNRSKQFKKKLIKNITNKNHKNQYCDTKSCILFDSFSCNLGIPCLNCIEKEQLKNT